MDRAPRSLQEMAEKQIGELPRLLLTQLVREKLEPLGHSGNDALVGALIDHLFSGEDDDSFGLGDQFGEVLPDGFTLEFDDEDLARLESAVADFTKELPDILRGSAKEAAKEMLRHYKASWFEWRPHAVAEMDQFKANLEARWSKGFDLLRMLIDLSRDQGIAFHKRASRSRSPRRAHLNTVLVNLHARAIQIASEIMTLMEGGFADGAMARWRTLHEVTCVAMVINEGGDALAERYLAHEVYEAKKALGQYQKCHAALGYAPPSARNVKQVQQGFDAAVAKYGKDFASDYGWVAAHLGIPRPTFGQIEEAAGRAMMRSHYKMPATTSMLAPRELPIGWVRSTAGSPRFPVRAILALWSQGRISLSA